jgi:pSer/pThr/pTyr-binding forkhead associated (FHA) protein
VFPDDPFVSRRHANFFYRDGKLVVRDEGSLNGVYVRVRGTVEISPGDSFLAGEQLFRLDLNPQARPTGKRPTARTSIRRPSTRAPSAGADPSGRLARHGVCARTQSLQIGREGGDLNFPDRPLHVRRALPHRGGRGHASRSRI